jgi:hypothetical protein
MPESKARRRTKPPRKGRDKSAEARARETQSAQKEAEAKKLTPAAYRRWRILGWGLVALGVLVGVQHLVSHLGFFNIVSPGVDDLVAGYPLAGALGVGGAIVLSKT